jgi:hypothetical protein
VARPKLPEKTRQEMFAHWVQTNNYVETSRAFGVSEGTVRNVVKDMPEYYAREHERMRQEFVQEAWHMARKALREIDKKLPSGSLKDVSVAFGIIAQRATNAMYAAQKSGMNALFIQNNQEIKQPLLTGHDIAMGLRAYEEEQKTGITDHGRRERLLEYYRENS